MKPNKAILEKYKIKMENVVNQDGEDEEVGHINCDKVLCELAEELGYQKVLDIYDKQHKWYA